MVHYHIELNPNAHLFYVRLQVAVQADQVLDFEMPRWTPGSYLIRDFAKNITQISASDANGTVPLEALDSHHWRVQTRVNGELNVRYAIFAWDHSVRTVELSIDGGFINGAALFMACTSLRHLRHQVSFDLGARDWQIATAMTPIGEDVFSSADYDECIDHPFLLGYLQHYQFEAQGIAHALVIQHPAQCHPQFDSVQTTNLLAQICRTQISFFNAPAPMAQYLFLLRLQESQYGGLEHRASSALVSDRLALPQSSDLQAAQFDFLGLCSHEYFHTWWVKSVRPQRFMPYDLSQPQETSLLWIFEGFTSYYDELFLWRSGVMPTDTFLQRLSTSINESLQRAGLGQHSLSAASKEAWIKYYQPDANSSNSQVSYYSYGALAALTIDWRLRTETLINLDDVVRYVWQHYRETGLRESGADSLCALLTRLSGVDWNDFFARYIDGHEPLPVLAYLDNAGLNIQSSLQALNLGLTLIAQGELMQVRTVRSGSAAERAGICPQDKLVGLDGLKLTPSNYQQRLKRYAQGDRAVLHLFRQDILHQVTLEFTPLALQDYQVSWPIAPSPRLVAWAGLESA